ncbi:MAG: type II toxin-antitoxin system VapC family toxin [Acidobacteriaceae bacterium]|nr:type II toxin-antitoxin system VapC family toxin [Acidobacteriaceae bacterium]MBV9939541.1 type II toxin-antitoxin system VapC family toxin [Acidobacteriaceae bacterium]
MLPRLLLDTHIVVRWLGDIKRLSREQARVLERAVQRAEPIALSATTLLEVAVLVSERKLTLKMSLDEFFGILQSNPIFRVLPITYEIASDVFSLVTLKDPADRAIVATARVHRLQLVTSDERIIESRLVPVVE